jgi:glutamine amidotransferase
VIPGVGHFAKAMQNIRQLGIIEILNRKVVQEKTPVIGICLGMQLLTRWSDEGAVKGLGWIDAQTKLFQFDNHSYKVPHIGWNRLNLAMESPILFNIKSDQRFYFVHSYHVICNNLEDVLTNSLYGGFEFVSSLHRNNILGTQFHPEKSHRRGMQIINNFYNHVMSLSGN